MTFLVTGANGFIGSYLCNYLLKNGHKVIALSRKFLPEIKTTLSGAEFIETDILSPEFEKLSLQADVVVHLAASNDIISKSLAKGVELSVTGTVNALKFTANNKIPKFIFYSTLQVYGTELQGNYTEQTAVKPENDYAMNHLFAEMYVEMFSRKLGLQAIVARPSNIYGRFLSPNINRWTLVPGCFVKEALEKGTITMLSSGNQTRNFISLEQLSYYTATVAHYMSETFDIVNFVSDDYKRIVDVAELTKELVERIHNKEIDLQIKSDQPLISNAFHLGQEKLLQFGIDTNAAKGYSLETEIEQIIRTLASNPSNV
jgi:UDP-glucose 4-epimerase